MPSRKYGPVVLIFRPQVFGVAEQKLRVGVAALRLFKAGKIKEGSALAKPSHARSRRDSAEEAGYDAHRESVLAQRRAVQDELRIEQNGAHHEGGQPVIPHTAARERRRDRDGAVHTQRRGDAERAAGREAERAGLPAAERPDSAVDAVFQEYGHRRAESHAQHPVPEDLAQLDVKVVPEIDGFPLKGVHHRSPAFTLPARLESGSPGGFTEPAFDKLLQLIAAIAYNAERRSHV